MQAEAVGFARPTERCSLLARTGRSVGVARGAHGARWGAKGQRRETDAGGARAALAMHSATVVTGAQRAERVRGARMA